MGYRELVEALRETGEKDVRAVREAAETEVRRMKAEAAKRIEQKRDEYRKLQSSAIREQTEYILSEAKRRAADMKLRAAYGLSERLYRLAVSRLTLLRTDDYDKVFDALVSELPPYEWETVRVNPEDEARAKRHFRDSPVVPDDRITGGVEVFAERGKVRVVNTLEKRLERAWPEVLPELMSDVSDELSEHGNTS